MFNMAERKIITQSILDPEKKRQSTAPDLAKDRRLSGESTIPEENDDVVFTDDCNGKFFPKSSRSDSGISSRGHSTMSTSSDSRFSVQSWNTLSNKTNVSEHSSSVKSLGSPATQKKKNSNKLAAFVGKHMPFTSSFDVSPALPISSARETDTTDLEERQQPFPKRKGNNRKFGKVNKGTTTPYEYFVEPSTVLGALKLLEQRQSSGNQFAATGQQVSFGTCSVGFFDANGGQLTLQNQGATLYIPPGAIKSPTPQIVYIFGIPSHIGEPKLKVNETWLTQEVECGPSGLEFDKDVFLSLPHCAINHSQWTVNAHRGKDSLQSGKDTVIFLDDKRVILAIDHFSPYKVSGRRSSTSSSEEEEHTTVSKWMKAAIFPKNQTKSDEAVSFSYQLRLCNVQDWKLVLREESITDETEISSQLLPVSDDGQNIELGVKDVLPGWQITQEIPQFVQFDDVWSNYQEAFRSGRLSIPFTLKSESASTTASTDGSSATQAETTLCRLEVKQIQDAIVELTASVPKQLGDSRRKQRYISRQRTEDEICREIENRFLAQQSMLDPDPRSLRYLNDTSYRRVCTALDNANSVQKGWAAFAASMGINDIQIQGSLESWSGYNKRSPSAMLLDFFFFDNCTMDLLDTLKMLSSLFHQIGNNPAKAMIDNEIDEHEDGDRPACFEKDTSVTIHEMANQDAANPAAIVVPSKSEKKTEKKYLKWVANFGEFVSKQLGMKKVEKVTNETQTMDADCDQDKSESAAPADIRPSELVAGNNNGLYDYTTLSRVNSSGVNLLLSRGNSNGTNYSDMSTTVNSRPKHSLSSDTNDASRYLGVDSSKPTKSLSRHNTHDSGVFSQRGSSRASSSSQRSIITQTQNNI